MTLGLSTEQLEYMKTSHYSQATSSVSRARAAKAAQTAQSTTATTSTTSTNSCTDGEDDGKIGFFSAIGHAVKGAAKSIVKGIKGCFTNSEGKFSIGKTLLTVGIGAACIAFPAVGLVACGVGAVMGGITLGKGVYSAATAKTDAEAKDAWESIGDGAFTVASSVLGAKASIKAVKATSTAGLTSVDDAVSAAQKAGVSAEKLKGLDNVDDVLRVAKEAGVKVDASKLGNLDDAASMTQKIRALGSDMASSTKNQANVVGAKISNVTENAKTTKDAKTYNSNKERISELEGKKENLTEKEASTLKNLKEQNAKLEKSEATLSRAGELAQEAKNKETLAQEVNSAKEALKTAKKAGGEEEIKAAQQALNEALSKQKESTTFGKLTTQARQTAETVKDSAKGKYEKFKENGGVEQVLTDMKDANKKEVLSGVYNKLSTRGKAIYDALTDKKYSYNEIVSQYGYDNTLEVIEAVQGYIYAKETV